MLHALRHAADAADAFFFCHAALMIAAADDLRLFVYYAFSLFSLPISPRYAAMPPFAAAAPLSL